MGGEAVTALQFAGGLVEVGDDWPEEASGVTTIMTEEQIQALTCKSEDAARQAEEWALLAAESPLLETRGRALVELRFWLEVLRLQAEGYGR